MLKLNSAIAKSADNIASTIQESGKYIGVITRAECLSSPKGTEGLGLSFKADNGMSADYLDLWHTNGSGEPLSSLKTVHAIMCCAQVAEAAEGPIKCEKWNKDKGARETVTVTGYPALMGKRIGLLLRKTLETDNKGKDRTRMEVFGVFSATSELTASEMYAKAQHPERLAAMLEVLMAKPVIDKRDNQPARPARGGSSGGFDDRQIPAEAYGDDCPF